MQENMTPKEALAILMGLRNSDEKAHELLPDGQDLVVTLVQLSDIAAAETGQLAQITGDCQQAKKMEAFLAKELPLEEMAQYALHLIICIPCRTAISGRGIRPYQRSTEALRHALAGIQPDKEPVSG